VTTTTLPRAASHRRALDPARLLRGRAADPRWVRPALLGLLALTAFLYLFDLSRNGWANDFYAAAVQAGAKSWKAFFFGSFDSSNFITVDKTPGSLWVMELSARVFGVNYWSLLVPQALAGVGTVALLYATVRRWFGPAAGLLAGLVMALTPVAVLMFRFNNPDALLVLLMTGAAYAMTRAIENGRTKWLVTAGSLIGFAFLTKMLQAFLVVPGFAVAYLWAGPVRLRRRVWQLVVAGLAVVVSAGWWVLAAQLTPAADRPYFGGSTDNNVLQLAIGYNGLGRLTGQETGSIGGAQGGGGFGGATGLGRLFSAEFGGQASWLLPTALLCLLVLLATSARAARTDRTRAATLIWGGWLLVTALVFSYMSGIIHTYYTVALVPAIAALVGIGAATLWRTRHTWPTRASAAVILAVTAVWAYALLNRTPTWLPWLRWTVLLAGLAAAAATLAWPHLATQARSHRGKLALAAIPLTLGLFTALSGQAAYALDTISTSYTGSLPTAGPETSALGGPGGGGAPGGTQGGPPGRTGTHTTPGRTGTGGTGTGTGGTGTGGTGTGTGFPGGMGTGSTGTGTGRTGTGVGGNAGLPGGTGTRTGSGTGTGGRTGTGFPGGTRGAGTGGPGGLSGNTQVSSALVHLLERGAAGYKWVAATEGSQEAAPLELATGGDAVMAIGGFNGTDPTPTLAEFKVMVASHEIHYYIGQNSESFGGGHGSSAIAEWVAAHFKSETIGGNTVYNLTEPRTT
jgi:4-amino-4-deoxy-L-arabinose transferase-like glycosyltransferase